LATSEQLLQTRNGGNPRFGRSASRAIPKTIPSRGRGEGVGFLLRYFLPSLPGLWRFAGDQTHSLPIACAMGYYRALLRGYFNGDA
jgi:hypothetical protein